VDTYKEFPRPAQQWKSHYEYKRLRVKVEPDGSFNWLRLLVGQVDFSFVRSLLAHVYTPVGAPGYDPVSLFLLDLFRYLDNYDSMKLFLKDLADPFKGHAYRYYAGIHNTIPVASTFSDFRTRIGEDLYNEIFHILVEIVRRLGLVTGRILSTDGTLFPTFARYRGCPHFTPECREIPALHLLDDARNKAREAINNPYLINKPRKACVSCPFSERFKPGQPIPRLEVISFKIAYQSESTTASKDQTALLLGLSEQLEHSGLQFVPLRSNLVKINLDLRDNPASFCCPRVPADLDARVGVRRRKDNPSKTENVLGFDCIITMSVEPQLGIALPVACFTIAGNQTEGEQFRRLHDQVQEFHPDLQPALSLADSGNDSIENYQYCRRNKIRPVIAYNKRNEKLSQAAQRERGYDSHGCPFAPCGLPTRPNGFCEKEQRVSFVCSKQCEKITRPPSFHEQCPHRANAVGFATHMSIRDYPRLILEFPRGSAKYQKLYNLRGASERANSTAKADRHILEKPRVMGLERAAILSQIAVIVILLKTFIFFIIKVTKSIDKKIEKSGGKVVRLFGPKVPDFIFSILFPQQE